MSLLALSLALLPGCFSETDYADGYWEATCERNLECLESSVTDAWYTDVESCLEYNATNIEATETETRAEDCTFDRAAAQECVDGIYELSCDEFRGGEFPESCQEVCGG